MNFTFTPLQEAFREFSYSSPTSARRGKLNGKETKEKQNASLGLPATSSEFIKYLFFGL
jgi:hypothetical protein